MPRPAFFIPAPRGYSLTSGWGDPRPYGRHEGVDLAGGKPGDPAYASAFGRVVKVAYDPRGYGKHVVVEHPGGWRTLYGHLDTPLVRPGQTVRAGTPLGVIGSTGFSTGRHLHFSIISPTGRFINPLTLTKPGAPLTPTRATKPTPAPAARPQGPIPIRPPQLPIPKIPGLGAAVENVKRWPDVAKAVNIPETVVKMQTTAVIEGLKDAFQGYLLPLAGVLFGAAIIVAGVTSAGFGDISVKVGRD